MRRKGSSFAANLPYFGRSSGGSTPWTAGNLQLLNSYVIESFSHPRYKGGYGNTPGDNGGPFYLSKVTHGYTSANVCRNGLCYPNGTYTGPIIAGTATGFVPTGHQTEPNDSEVAAFGATAISRVHPERPDFSLAQQVGEMRERFPHIIGSTVMRDKVNVARSIGDEYLNVEFGWKPLVSSVLDFARAVKAGNAEVRSYVQKSERLTRRRYSFPQTYTVTVNNAVGGSFLPSIANITGTGSVSEIKLIDRWFVGAWKVYTPVGDTANAVILRTELEANRLLGTRLTPGVLWELAPWSWAADWFSNTGDILNNISYIASDASVMKYGYMMNHLQTKFQLQLTAGNSGQGKSSSHSIIYDKKMRAPASPYGFGVNWDGMTPRQIAIATALGLTRS